MNILFLEAVHNFGGAARSTLELATILKKQGHTVLIVDFWGCSTPFIKKLEELNINYQTLDPREEPIILGDSHFLKKINLASSYFFTEKKYRKKLDGIIKDFHPDRVIVNSLKCLNLLKKAASYKIDFYAHRWFNSQSISTFFKNRLKHYRPRFVALSQATRQALYCSDIADLGQIKVCSPVIPEHRLSKETPTPPEVFSTSRPMRILHAAGFYKEKGQFISLQIAHQLKERKIPFQLTLAGIIYADEASKIHYKAVTQLIKELHLEKQVRLVVNRHQINSYLEETDLLIHPSSTEGLGRVILEAFAKNKPAIANPVGGITDLIIPNFNGFLPDFNEVEQYLNYIITYYHHPELLQIHGKSGQELVRKNYMPSHQQEILKRLYPLP